MQDQPPDLDWTDRGVPVSRRFDDPYFSLDNGLAETRHVFLAGNGLPERFAPGFHIAELGFGTGLNFLTVWQAWIDSGTEGPLRFTSFEAFPMAAGQMAAALTAFPELTPLSAQLVANWDGPGRVILPGAELTVIAGDARLTLPAWNGQADAWFLDGFSPAKNPEMWDDALLTEVARHMTPGGTLATYTAAGHVRRALAQAGLAVDRRPGYGRKRHMTVAART
ncbi:MAG: tRNA (5-methylaminomethyl-2-thiouridine)(34)-methyltransferase MnmD [Proteobacteria bacterium]|nr:tRNA (5-methylaminomethyl-2-thiouridine)(34)-methyltransferase MnmD [Pseudomonadota bacterium]